MIPWFVRPLPERCRHADLGIKSPPVTQESACDISRIVGSSSFVDVERGSFVSEELEMTPAELSAYAVDMDVDGEADFSDDEGDVV